MVSELIDYYGLNVVQAYMNHIQNNAEVAVRDLLRTVGARTYQKTGKSVLTAYDYMDDGSPIKLTVSIEREIGSAIFDFRLARSSIWYVRINAWNFHVHFVVLAELGTKFGATVTRLEL